MSDLLTLKAPQLALRAAEIASPLGCPELSFVLGVMTARASEDRESFEAAYVVIAGLLIQFEGMEQQAACDEASRLIREAAKRKVDQQAADRQGAH